MLSVQGLLIMFLLGILVNILYEGIKTEIKSFRYRKQYEKRLRAVDTTGLNLYQVRVTYTDYYRIYAKSHDDAKDIFDEGEDQFGFELDMIESSTDDVQVIEMQYKGVE
jgi:hypothetical protein